MEGSFECRCYKGYYKAEDEVSCVDIDECSCVDYPKVLQDRIYDLTCEENGGCEHICNNANGTFGCGCNEGYELKSNGKNCRNVNECETGRVKNTKNFE